MNAGKSIPSARARPRTRITPKKTAKLVKESSKEANGLVQSGADTSISPNPPGTDERASQGTTAEGKHFPIFSIVYVTYSAISCCIAIPISNLARTCRVCTSFHHWFFELVDFKRFSSIHKGSIKAASRIGYAHIKSLCPDLHEYPNKLLTP